GARGSRGKAGSSAVDGAHGRGVTSGANRISWRVLERAGRAASEHDNWPGYRYTRYFLPAAGASFPAGVSPAAFHTWSSFSPASLTLASRPIPLKRWACGLGVTGPLKPISASIVRAAAASI